MKTHLLRPLAAAALALCAAALLISCSFGTQEEGPGHSANTENVKMELNIFAAASLQETLTEITQNYEKEHPETSFICTFDSSGTLKTQIEEGAPCDIFISAAQKQMDELEHPESGDSWVDSETRIDLLENKVTLVVPDDNPLGLTGFDDLARRLREGGVLLAVGNSDVPVGQYTLKIFEYYDLSEEQLAASGELTYGSNVKEVTTQVSEAGVDAGIIYATDAFSAGLTVVGEATPEMCGQVIYPAAVLTQCRHKDEAENFLQYLTTPEAVSVFESVGFSPAF